VEVNNNKGGDYLRVLASTEVFNGEKEDLENKSYCELIE